MDKMNIISGISEILLGLLVSFIFIIFYFFSDFSNLSETTLWVFRILYLGIIPTFGLILVIRGIIRIFKKKEEKEIS